MRTVIILFSLFLFELTFGQHESKQNQISINDNMFVMLKFPDKIEFNKISVATENNIGISVNGETMYIQALTTDIPKSNLMVQTSDGLYYSFIIEFQKDIKESDLTHFYTQNDAMNTKSISVNKSDQTIVKSVESKNIKPNLTKDELSKLPTIERIFNEKGFIKSRNVTKNQGISAAMTGVYFVKEKIYIQFSLANETNIDYDIDSLLFTIQNRRSKNKVSEQVVDLEPTAIYRKLTRLNKNTKGEVIVFEFDKLTIDSYKVLRFEMIESKGERNLEYNISNDILKDARLLD